MKRISFFLAFVLTLCAFGIANAQNAITVDNVQATSGVLSGTTLQLGPTASTVSFQLRVQSDVDLSGGSIAGTTCGFEVYTVGGSIDFSGINASELPAWDALNFGLVSQTPEYNPDGSPDTVAFEFSKFIDGGAPPNYNDLSWQVAVTLPGLSDASSDGMQLCIDSVLNYGPANLNWIWNDFAGGEINPTWNGDAGAYCLTLEYLPNQPPAINNCPVVQQSVLHCATYTVDLNATDPEGNPFTFELVSGPAGASVDANSGLVTYDPAFGDIGLQVIEVAANDGQQGPICTIEVLVENDAPQVTNCPAGPIGVQTNTERLTNLDASDTCPADAQNWSIFDDGGASGALSVDASGVVSFTPDATDAMNTPITIIVEVSDGNASSQCEITYDVFTGAPYGIVIEKDEGQTGVGALQGQYTEVDVTFSAAAGPLGGFNLLFAYDNSALSFASIETAGSQLYDVCEWEYLNYRVGADGNCSGGCPSGLVRVVGIADMNDGPNHPVIGCDPTGLMFQLRFLVSNDRTLECQYVPIRFFWLECGDNTLSSEGGDTLYISQTVQDWNGFDPQDPWGDDLGPAVGFPTYAGHPAECATSDKNEVIRGIDFFNGGVDIVCADEIDDRGDINLDGLAYTIADAVMLTNYFIYGMNALPANTVAAPFARQAAIAASDVNADGLTLTVADLVYLIRVVVGDAVPYPKVDPVAARYDVSVDGMMTVEGDMGAAYIVVNDNVQPELLADGMELVSNFRDGQTHIVVWSREGNSFNGSFVNLGSDNIAYLEMATAEGAPVTSLVGDLVPDNFALAQNYPNPFNPSTTIEFSLPSRSDYSLKIYNVTGQLVKEFTGTENAGVHSIVWDASNAASGIYFYKMNAGDYSETKKAVFLK